MSILFFIPIGMLVGTLSGFFGIGGGIILMPILLLCGFEPTLAVATSLMFTFGTSLSGAVTHTKMNNVDWRIAAVTGTVGAVFAQASNRIVFYISGKYDYLLNVWLILILCYFAWSLFNKKKIPENQTQALFKNHYLPSVLLGMMIGFLAALLGIGGGFITVPLLMSWMGFNSKKAIGTSLATIIIISIGGIVGYGTQLELNYLLGLCLIIGAFLGSPLGARMTARYQAHEMTQRLWILYLAAIGSIFIDLLAIFTFSFLEWVSLSILIGFLGYMLVDFYRHHPISQAQVTRNIR